MPGLFQSRFQSRFLSVIISSIMKAIQASATEAKLGALFYNVKDGIMLHTTLTEMGHPQLTTPIQTDNACAAGIVNNTEATQIQGDRHAFLLDQRSSQQGQFLIHWRRGADNLADYFTKHHSPAHHRLMRSRYLLELHRPPDLEPDIATRL